jgi:hypothetical protein
MGRSASTARDSRESPAPRARCSTRKITGARPRVHLLRRHHRQSALRHPAARGERRSSRHRYGPHLETHPNFPRKTNVQFLQVLDRANIRIEIWERGAGYTLASGSSSSAAAAVAHRLGLVDRDVTVHMPGGRIGIEIGDGLRHHDDRHREQGG